MHSTRLVVVGQKHCFIQSYLKIVLSKTVPNKLSELVYNPFGYFDNLVISLQNLRRELCAILRDTEACLSVRN